MTSYDPDYDEFAELPSKENTQHESIYSNDGAEIFVGATDTHEDIYFTDVEDLKSRRESDRVPPPLPKPAPRKISSTVNTQTSISRGIILSTQNESLPTPPTTPKSPSYAGQSATNSFTRYGGSSEFGTKQNQRPVRNAPDDDSLVCSLDCAEICERMKSRNFIIVATVVLIIMLLAGLTVLIVYLLGNWAIFYSKRYNHII